jgi:hypothetical protein
VESNNLNRKMYKNLQCPNHLQKLKPICKKHNRSLLPLLLRLHVLVGEIRGGAAHNNKGVQPEAETRGLVAGAGALLARGGRLGDGVSRLAAQRADEQAVEDLARLVAVADVLEGLGRVLAGDVEDDLLAAAGGELACERGVDKGRRTGARRQRSWCCRPCRG